MNWDALDDDWAEAPAAAEFENVPDGVYEAVTGDATIKRTQADEPRLSICCEITAGPHAGRTVWYGSMFRAKSLPFLKRDLAKFGISLASIKEIRNPDVLDRMSRIPCRIRVKTKKDFTNVYFEEIYTTPPEPPDPPARPPSTPGNTAAPSEFEDDIPF